MIGFFHVSWYVCQTQTGGLWSSCRVKLAPEEEGEGEREREGGEENRERLIVHKSSHSIVSGEPPAALADVVPMKRSKHAHPLSLRGPSSQAGWDATSL